MAGLLILQHCDPYDDRLRRCRAGGASQGAGNDGRNCHEFVNFFDNSLLNLELLFLPRGVPIDGSQ